MPVKQVIIVRKDLGMRRGKQIAQACHASMKVLLDNGRIRKNKMNIDLWPEAKQWLDDNFAKICCDVNSEEELDNLYGKAIEASIPVAMIRDSGKTEFHGVVTKTCIAIGPYISKEIDKITGHLKLL